MDQDNAIGIAAMVFSAATLIPQIISTTLSYKKKNFTEVLAFNPVSMVMGIIANALWVWYAARRADERMAVLISSVLWLALWLSFALLYLLARLEQNGSRGIDKKEPQLLPRTQGSSPRR